MLLVAIPFLMVNYVIWLESVEGFFVDQSYFIATQLGAKDLNVTGNSFIFSDGFTARVTLSCTDLTVWALLAALAVVTVNAINRIAKGYKITWLGNILLFLVALGTAVIMNLIRMGTTVYLYQTQYLGGELGAWLGLHSTIGFLSVAVYLGFWALLAWLFS